MYLYWSTTPPSPRAEVVVTAGKWKLVVAPRAPRAQRSGVVELGPSPLLSWYVHLPSLHDAPARGAVVYGKVHTTVVVGIRVPLTYQFLSTLTQLVDLTQRWATHPFVEVMRACCALGEVVPPPYPEEVRGGAETFGIARYRFPLLWIPSRHWQDDPTGWVVYLPTVSGSLSTFPPAPTRSLLLPTGTEAPQIAAACFSGWLADVRWSFSQPSLTVGFVGVRDHSGAASLLVSPFLAIPYDNRNCALRAYRADRDDQYIFWTWTDDGTTWPVVWGTAHANTHCFSVPQFFTQALAVATPDHFTYVTGREQ